MDFEALGYKGDPAITGGRFKKTASSPTPIEGRGVD